MSYISTPGLEMRRQTLRVLTNEEAAAIEGGLSWRTLLTTTTLTSLPCTSTTTTTTTTW